MALMASSTHPLLGAITGLSYPAISAACAPEYDRVQVSPPRLMQVALRACSPPARYAFNGYPLPTIGVRAATGCSRFRYKQDPFRSPGGPFRRRPTSRLGLGRSRLVKPAAPVATLRA